MSREEIDAAISRHAEFELLYDKPYEDTKKVRVTGPFTVESLSPHRSLAFSGSAEADGGADQSSAPSDAEEPRSSRRSSTTWRKAGVQNGRRNERLSSTTIEPYAGQSHPGPRRPRADAPERDAPTRVAICDRPAVRHGRRRRSSRRRPARPSHAGRRPRSRVRARLRLRPRRPSAPPTRTHVERPTASPTWPPSASLGRVPVLLVRMNADLLMGEDLKKTGKGNLFTVFGEPDIAIRTGRRQLVVEITGVDVYDPTTGEVRSRDTDQHRPLDDRHELQRASPSSSATATSPAGNDPYARLKKALKADIDEDAWASLSPHRLPALRQAGDRQDRGQGHQRLRRRSDEGVRHHGFVSVTDADLG